MQDQTAPVLIVGSGPSGLVLALSLRMNGIDVRIIEKKSAYPVGQRGAGIQPRSLEVHHFLGTFPDIEERAMPCPIVRMFAPPPNSDKVLKEITMAPTQEPTSAIPYPNAVLLGQNNQEAILRKHLAKYDCHVELGTQLDSFEQFDGHVVAVITKTDRDGQQVEERTKYRWLIGADGARGVVRKQLGLSFLGETRDGTNLLLGDIHTQGPVFSQDTWYVWGNPQQLLINVRPTEDENVVNFIILGTSNGDAKALPTREEFLDIFYRLSGRHDVKFGDLVWIGNYRPNMRMVDKFGKGRVFLVGDAAHVHSPTGGQGMNSSIQDSFNLAWKLTLIEKGHAPMSLLDSYSEERLPVIAEMLRLTTNLFNVTVKGDAENASKRGGSLDMLGVNYRGSSIVFHEGLPKEEVVSSYESRIDGTLRAGDRAPDAGGLVTKSGRETRLFDIFKPTHHTALILTSGPDCAPPVVQALGVYPKGTVVPVVIGQHGAATDALVDRDGHVTTNYNATGQEERVVIVRPDGVIGAIVCSVEGVNQYFSKIFI